MIKLLTATVLTLTVLTSCTIMEAIDESNLKLEQEALDIVSPTKAEYEAILKRAETEAVTDSSPFKYKWLYVDTLQDGRKVFVDTKGAHHNKNTATGTVKFLNHDNTYTLTTYRFFCEEGYGQRLFDFTYDADHKQISQFRLGAGGEHYDRRPDKSEEPIAKTICALGGFYRGSSNDNV